jgi:hypothetical protein
MRAYLVAIAVLAAALLVFLGLVQPPLVLKEASDTAASVNARDQKKEMRVLVGDTENTRR